MTRRDRFRFRSVGSLAPLVAVLLAGTAPFAFAPPAVAAPVGEQSRVCGDTTSSPQVSPSSTWSSPSTGVDSNAPYSAPCSAGNARRSQTTTQPPSGGSTSTTTPNTRSAAPEAASAATAAATSGVKGSACGYVTNVGLFGGPQNLRGCGQTAGGDPSASPKVDLPAGGSASPVTASKATGAKATYGPAAIFSGRWPADVAAAPPSGPISVSTEGTPGGGTVKSSADIVLNPSPPEVPCTTDPAPPAGTICHAPGGFGPGPVEGDELHATCTATDSSVTGSATFVKGLLTLTTDSGGSPLTQEPIPDSPPPNYTRSGVITNVGDVFTVVFNQQVVNADGSLTVDAFHMYLFGPTAVGESIGGQVVCGTDPHPAVEKDTQAPSCGAIDVEPTAPDNPTPKVPHTELIGVFDAQGLQSITNVQSTNAKVDVGSPDPNALPYLKFSPGQTGPVPITATKVDESQPMTWSFDATDSAGNVTHSSQCPTDSAALTNASTVSDSGSGSSGSGGGSSGSASGSSSGSGGSGTTGVLGKTGIEVARMVETAALLVGAGALVLLAARRRRAINR